MPTKPYDCSVVRVLIRNHRNRFLLVKKASRQMWHLPGGQIDRGEKPIVAAGREPFEEVALRLNNLTRLLRLHLQTQRGIERTFCFGADKPQRQRAIPDMMEIDDVAWCSLEDLPRFNTTTTTLEILQHLPVISYLYREFADLTAPPR